MAASRHHGPAAQVGHFRGDRPGHQHHVLRVHGKGARNLDDRHAIVQGLDGHARAKVLPVAAHRCSDRARQIVDGCERAEKIPIVDGEQVAVAVAPRAPPLPDPRRRPDRRVHQRVGEGLWIVTVDGHVTRAQGSGRRAALDHPRLVRIVILRRDRHEVESGEQRDGGEQTDDVLRMSVRDLPAEHRAPVSAPDGEAGIAQHGRHQLGEQLGALRDVESGLSKRHREAEARQRGNDEIKRLARIAAVRRRIRQRPHQGVKVHERPGPAMK